MGTQALRTTKMAARTALRKELIRLAHADKALRPHVLALLADKCAACECETCTCGKDRQASVGPLIGKLESELRKLKALEWLHTIGVPSGEAKAIKKEVEAIEKRLTNLKKRQKSKGKVAASPRGKGQIALMEALKASDEIDWTRPANHPAFKGTTMNDRASAANALVKKGLIEQVGSNRSKFRKVAIHLSGKETIEFFYEMRAAAELARRSGSLLAWDNKTNKQVESWLAAIASTNARMDGFGNTAVKFKMGTASVEGVIHWNKSGVYLKLKKPTAMVFYDAEAAVDALIRAAVRANQSGMSAPVSPAVRLRKRQRAAMLKRVVARYKAAAKK